MIQEQVFHIIALNLIWQTALIASVVFVGLIFLPKTQTKIRYLLSLSGLFGAIVLLFVPFLPEFAPNLSVGITPTYDAGFSPTVISEANEPVPISVIQSIPITKTSLPSLSTLFFGIWCVGIGFMLARLMVAGWQAGVWRSQAKLVISATHALSKSVLVLQSSHINAPMVLGLFRPVILVPHDFDTDVSNVQTRAVLEHEIAHITRGDLWVNFAQRLILAMLWWCIPLYWLNTQIGVEREKLCDDIAAQKTGTGKALARALVDLAELHSRISPPLLAIGIHPKTSHLSERVRRLYTGHSMIKLSRKLLLASSLAVPITLASLTIITPRAFAHNPFKDHIREYNIGQNVTPEQALLYSYCERGDNQAVQNLLSQGTNPNFVLHGDGTPLMVAVRRNDPKTFDALITAGADVNLAASGDGTPLIAAAYMGNLDMAEKLLQRGALINHASPGDGNPLIAAAMAGRLDMAQFLIQQGADVNAKVQGDETALINAAQQGRLEIVKYLMKYGADVNLGAWADTMQGRTWRTPLGEAKLHGHEAVISFLLANGARHTSPNKYEKSSVKIVNGKLTSGYGLRKKYNVKKGIDKLHRGIDIAGKVGTPIYAPADGHVQAFNAYSFQENYGSVEKYGKTLVLETSGGVTTLFAHLQGFAVGQGADVKAGDVIAYMGNTGVSTGPHVHIETHVNGDLVNPYEVWPNLR